MSNNKIDSNEFLYYLHGTSDESKDTLENIFTEGLKDYYGISLSSTMKEIYHNDIEKYGLEKLMKGYTGGEHKSVFLIKIPKKYMGLVLHRDGTIDFPVPLLKKTDEIPRYGIGNGYVYRLTPHLIQGVYNKTTDMFVTNPNFSPVFDPNGLEYSDEQIKNFWSICQINWVKYAESRHKYSYEQLYNDDLKRNNFSEYMNDYSKYFKVRPKKIEKVSLKEYEQELNSKYELNQMLNNNSNENNYNNKK